MKIFLDMVGCRLNQSEIEKFASQFRAAGHEIVGSAADADYVVINTCAVTAEAASDSRQKIRQAARLGGGRPRPAEIVVTGCWSAIDAAGAQALPGVTRVVGNEAKDRLVADLLHLPEETFDLEPVAREPLPGAHLRTRAFIKVQDGCDNHCTFCVTRLARGKGRSRPVVEVLRDIRSALDGGAQEVVLTGVHLGSWGQDFDRPSHLFDLIAAILGERGLPRLRLSSLEPWDLDGQFFSLWSDARLCRHLHLPLQSGAPETLRRMARKTTPEAFARLVDAARSASPQIAITTDVIAGFPGETDADFAASLDFVRQINFAAGHVFTYSSRPGTAAARMPGHLPLEVRKQRNAAMRAAFAESAENYRRQFLGAELEVLWESTDAYGPQGWQLHGLTDNYLKVSARSPEKLWNTLSRVRLEEVDGDGLAGVIVANSVTTGTVATR
jgi:threonylcarbamoyladenosine tRNA methylthiotransferase MtaB